MFWAQLQDTAGPFGKSMSLLNVTDMAAPKDPP